MAPTLFTDDLDDNEFERHYGAIALAIVQRVELLTEWAGEEGVQPSAFVTVATKLRMGVMGCRAVSCLAASTNIISKLKWMAFLV